MEEDKAPKVEFNHSEEQALYSDIAEINVTNDSVTIAFALKDREGKNAKVSHTVYLSIPHFMKFADVCYNVKNSMVAEMTKKVEEYKNKSQK